MSDLLQHLTLNTGHLRPSPRQEVGAAALAALTPAVRAGGAVMPAGLADHRWQLAHREPGAALWTVYRGDVPLATSGVGWIAEPAARCWVQIERAYINAGDTPEGRAMGVALPDAPAPPWCATILWPPLALYPASARWLADFNRCLAWTIITLH